MKIIKINLKNISKNKLIKISQIIKKGGVIVFPSDTCYGLAADATNPKAVRKVFQIKNRPADKPISVIVTNLEMAEKFAKINQYTKIELKKILPGSYTIILPLKKNQKIYTNTNNSISLRIPDFPFTEALSAQIQLPYTATSANLSGSPEIWSAQKAIKFFKSQKVKPDLIIDAGILPQKPLSKIVDFTQQQPKIILRS